jgi:hypothetical protein
MDNPKDQASQNQAQPDETHQNNAQGNAAEWQNETTRTGGGLGKRGQSGEQRNDACNDPDRHNTGVTGH